MQRIILGYIDSEFFVPDAGILEKLFCLLWVVGIEAGIIGVVGIARVEEGRSDFSATVGHIEDSLLVNRVVYRLADADVIEGSPGTVHGHDHDEGSEFLLYRDFGIGFKGGNVFRVHEFHGFDGTGLESLYLDGGFGNDVEFHSGELGQAFDPVLIVFDHGDLVVAHLPTSRT